MERLTKRLGNGLVRPFINGRPVPIHYMTMDEIQARLDLLADYEDAEEQGLLVRLPCKVGSHVWIVWEADGRKPEITEHYMSDLLHIVQWLDKFGKTVFLTRQEAEAALTKKMNGGKSVLSQRHLQKLRQVNSCSP